MLRRRLRHSVRGFLFLESQVRDDLGRWRAIPAWKSASAARPSLAGLDPARRDAVRRAYAERCTPAGSRWLCQSPWLAGLIALPFAIAIVVLAPGQGARLVLLAILAVLVAADLRYRRCLTWTDLMILRDVLLAHRVCPHCAYPLDGAPTDDQGRTTCPECAAAWRLDHAWKTDATGSPPNS